MTSLLRSKRVPFPLLTGRFLHILIVVVSAALFVPVSSSVPKVIIAPDTQSTHVSFMALGDQGTDGARQHLVSYFMERHCSKHHDINFTLLLGDNFYWDGVQSVKDPKWGSAFEEVYNSPCLAGMPFYAVLGNHDHRGNIGAELEYAKQHLGSGRWRLPGTHYIRNFGNVDGKVLLRMVILDIPALAQEGVSSEQFEFLERVFLGEKRAIWNVVAGHIPIRSCDKKYGDNDQLIDILLPRLQRYGVDLYLSGHAHNLQIIDRVNEPLYVISGAGGKRPLPLDDSKSAAMIYGKQATGFAIVSVDKGTLSVEFVTSAKEQDSIYTFVKDCGPSQDADDCKRVLMNPNTPRPSKVVNHQSALNPK